MNAIARRLLVATAACGLLLLGSAGVCPAKDLDDGIGHDDGFEFDNTIKKETNIKYVKEKAKAKARQAGEDPNVAAAGGGGTNINSAVVGGNVYGDIIIIDEGKGDKTVVKK